MAFRNVRSDEESTHLCAVIFCFFWGVCFAFVEPELSQQPEMEGRIPRGFRAEIPDIKALQ